jgi:Fe-S-cluster containining protein
LEIERLEKEGFSREQFVISRFGMSFLKHDEEGNCVFLRKDASECNISSRHTDSEDAGKYKASIGGCVCMSYANRPDTCRRYPNIRIGMIKGKDTRCKAMQDQDKGDV